MVDVICIGDATLDVFLKLRDDEAEVSCSLNKEKCQISLPYGSKIPVASVDLSLGGNAPNVAAGLKRLGFETGLLSRVGDDEIGSIIQSKLKAEGLSLSLVKETTGSSAYSTIINFKGERTILEKRYPHNYELPKDFPESDWLYLSSVGPSYEKFFGQVVDLAKQKNIKLAYNPSQAELRNNFKTYEQVLAGCYCLFVNKEEAGQLLAANRQPTAVGQQLSAIRKTLQDLHSLGPKYVAVTDGKNGSYATDGEKFYQCDIFPSEMVEATGAGDAFASGFLGALMSGQSILDAMKWGTVNASSVVTKVGAVAGLLSRAEIEKKVKEKPDFGPREV